MLPNSSQHYVEITCATVGSVGWKMIPETYADGTSSLLTLSA